MAIFLRTTLFLACLTCCVSDDAKDERKDLWLLGLFPFNGDWAGGLGQYPAIKMGLADVNADPNILPGYRLRMTVDNTECVPGIGLNALYRRLYEKKHTKIMVIGAGCSTVSEATAMASYLWNLVQLSYTSASPALSDKSRFKLFYRVFPPELSFNAAKFELLRSFGWSKVGTLTQGQDNLFALTTKDFLEKAPSYGVIVLTSETFATDPVMQVRNLKRHGVRIIIGNFYSDKARMVFCEAYKQNMYGEKYAWIITGFYRREWWKNDTLEDCTNEEVETAIDGYFTGDANPQSLSTVPGISGKTYEEFAVEYSNKTNYANQTAYQEAAYGYDCVWTVASMLNRSLEHMRNHEWDRRLEHFNYNDSEMSSLFASMMSRTMFQGVSGPVMFDMNGDPKGLTQIEQLQSKTEVRVAVYDPSREPGKRMRWENRSINWIGGSPPPDSILEKVVPKVISRSLFLCMTVLASLGIILSCFFLVFNIRYRKRKYIKMSSPNLNNVILAGAISAFMSVIVSGIDSSIGSMQLHLTMCKVYNWTLSLGFSLAFGAMFSKTWRVHKIFTNKKIQRMVIKDYQLMGIVCILVVLDFIVLSVWESLDPLKLVSYNKTLEQVPDPQNDNQVLIPQVRICESSHIWYFAGGLYAIKGLLLLFGAFLAFETRKVTVPALNDSKFIGVCVYNVVVLCLIGVPIALMMKEEVDACYLIISLFVFFATTLTICVVFIPKILHRNKEPHSGTMWTKSSDAYTTQRPMYTTGMDEMDKRQIDRLREENEALKFSLEQCQDRLRQLEALPSNGLAPNTCSDEVLLTADSLSMPLNTRTPDTEMYSMQNSV